MNCIRGYFTVMHHTSHLVTYSFTRIHNKTLFNKVIPFLLPQTKCICLLCIRQTAVSTMCKMTYLHISKHSLTDLYSYRFIFIQIYIHTDLYSYRFIFIQIYILVIFSANMQNVCNPNKRCLLPCPRYMGGRGIVFDRFLCLFISFFVSLLARLRENGCSDSHEIFREGAE